MNKSIRTANPASSPLDLPLVLIRGAGDLASGVGIRLFRSGFPVVMTEIERPLVVRRAVAFAQAIFDGETQVEEVRAVRSLPETVWSHLNSGVIPVLVDPNAEIRDVLQPQVLVDGVMAKKNTGVSIDDAPLVIALGPGFTASLDCHAVIETNRGHNLGKVIWEGGAEADTGTPGKLSAVPAGTQRALYAPADGTMTPQAKIGERLRRGEPVAHISIPDSDSVMPVIAPFDGVLRGLIHPSVRVVAGMKIGDLDPRIQPDYCFTVSDKSLAIGGGVLEAVMTAMHTSLLPRS